MATVKEIYEAVDKIAPFHTAMDFDNVGILVGDPEQEVNRAILALDITPAVIKEAKAKNCSLIISHHPVIFNPMRELRSIDMPYLLAKEGLSALCCHTNVDLSPNYGLNIALGMALGFDKVNIIESENGMIAFSGELENEMTPEAFAEHVKVKLKVNHVRFKPGKRNVKKVCFVGGAAGEYAETLSKQCDAYICGEMQHHEELIAANLDITVIAAGHYETEKVYAPLLMEYLMKNTSGTGYILAETESAPMWIV